MYYIYIKIICVGQLKTGTKTLAAIFNHLNYKVSGNPHNVVIKKPKGYIETMKIDNTFIDLNKFFNNINYLHDNLKNFDFFHDVPYSFNYKLINEQYPDTKFIFTIRDENDWFNSLLHYQKIYVNKNIINILYHQYIILEEHKAAVINLYRKYNADIIAYFKDKPDKLLIYVKKIRMKKIF
jgi:hypothetical protein